MVRGAIFHGTLKAGDRIVEGKLAKELNVGVSPVREALQQLEHVGLVERHSNKGTFVTKLTEGQLKQIYRLRVELELLSIKYAIDVADSHELDHLQELADQMLAAGRHKDYTKFFQADLDFHRQLCRVAADPYLEKCLVSLITPLFSFVHIRLKQEQIPFDFMAVAKSHSRIVSIIRRGDRDEAVESVHKAIADFGKLIAAKLYPRSKVQAPNRRSVRPRPKN